MPDLFDPLRDLDDLSSHPLPASEVRRRGDRMRRRRQALQTLGGAAAVVLVASGIAVGTGLLGTNDDPPPVATPAPEGGWLTEIPTHYPLDRGYPMENPPETTQLGPSQKFAPLTDQPLAPCGAAKYPTERPIDNVGTTFTVPDEFYARELTIYPDSTKASAVVSNLIDAYEACPTEELPDPPFELTTTVTRDNLGDDSWTVVRGADGFPGTQVYNVARVGNAVLINTASTAALLEKSGSLVDEQEAQVSPLVADMCVFALVPCSPVDRPDIDPTIPPLGADKLVTTEQVTTATGLSGWEQLGQREDPTIDCQSDWLRNLGAAESGSFREWRLDGSETATAVLQFPSRAEAAESFAEVRAWLDSCDDRLPGTRELTPVNDTSETTIGDRTVLTRLFSSQTLDGGNRLDQQGAALVASRIVFLAVGPDPSTGIEEERLLDGWTDLMADAIAAAEPVFSTDGSIPDDFPLVAGWPADEVDDHQATASLEFTACGETFEESSYLDRTNARWFSDEMTSHDRQLTTYATAAEAKAYVTALTEFYRACPTEEKDVTSHYEVRQTSTGDASFGIDETFTYQGDRATGISFWHVVRVGSAVLIDAYSSEGVPGPAGKSPFDRALTLLTDASPEVVAAMCLYGANGC